MPGKRKSEAYFATPVTLRGPSIRRVSRPMGEEVVGDCSVVAMIAPQKLACGGRSQCMRQTTLSQFDLELVFTLRLRAPQRGFGSMTEARIACRFSAQCSFRFGRAPGFGADPTERNSRVRNVVACDRENHRR